MQCVRPFRVFKNLNISEYPDGLEVPCGKCLACRVKKRQEWTARMIHESESHEDSIFITLTYDNNNLPYNRNKEHYRRALRGEYLYPTLRKEHFQNFIKRLRRDLEKDNRNIKYFATGEYGEQTRPHYHAIIFGLSLRDEDKQLVINNWPFCDWTIPEIRKKSFGLAEHDSMLYVSKYLNKIPSNDEELENYKIENRFPPFRLLSNGLGFEYAQKNTKQIIQNASISLRGIKQSIPRYYLKQLTEDQKKSLQQNLKLKAEENEAENIFLLTGEYITEKGYYLTQKTEDVVEYYEAKKRQKKQYALNIQAGINIKNARNLAKI